MHRDFIDQLLCPFCGGSLVFKEVIEKQGDEILNGCAGCRCREFPILEGILIIRDYVLNPFLIQAIRKGRIKEAVGLLCLPNRERVFNLIRLLQARGTLPRLLGDLISVFLKEKAHRIYDRYSKKGISFFELLGDDLFSVYLKHRFSAHTIWSAYPFIPILKERKGAILDFGCGAGHLSYILSTQVEPDCLVSVDYDFSLIYLAKKYFAPRAEYICLDGNYPLPFRDNFFSSLISLDAVHCIKTHTVLAREMERILLPQGMLVLLHLHNILQDNFSPNWPLTPTDWVGLFKEIPVRASPETSLIEDFLQRDLLDLIRQYSQEELDNSDAIALVGSRDPLVFQKVEQARQLFFNPHQPLIINPLYTPQTNREGVYWERKFPSERFRQEYYLAEKYMPERVVLEEDLDGKINGRTLNPPLTGFSKEEGRHIEKWMRRFVLIHAPEDYC